MFKLAIFDLDGTLVNSIGDIADATNYGLEKLGFPTHPVSDYYYFVGDGVNELCSRALPDNHQDKQQELLKFYNQYYKEHYTVKTKPYEGILETLKQLKAKGIILAVASNKTHIFAENVVKACFEDGVFSIVLGNAPERRRKPNGDIIETILSKLSIKKSEALMVGDTNIDIETAKNAGVKSAGCLWGFRTEEELRKASADYIIEKPSQLLQIFKET